MSDELTTTACNGEAKEATKESILSAIQLLKEATKGPIAQEVQVHSMHELGIIKESFVGLDSKIRPFCGLNMALNHDVPIKTIRILYNNATHQDYDMGSNEK